MRKPKATWARPKFYADIEYQYITSEGSLRATFEGPSKKERQDLGGV